MTHLDICKLNNEYPIKELFDAINNFQMYEELDQTTNLIRVELENYWKMIPEKQHGHAIKKYNGLKFYSNGLCGDAKSGRSIILSPWDSEINIKKQKNPRLNYKAIKLVSPLWYYQIMEYHKKRYKISHIIKFDKINNAVAFIDYFNSLPDNDQKNECVLKLLNQQVYVIRNFWRNVFDSIVYFNHSNHIECIILTEENIKYVIELYDIMSNGDGSKMSYGQECKLIDMLKEFKCKLTIDENNNLFHDLNSSKSDVNIFYYLTNFNPKNNNTDMLREIIELFIEKFNSVEEPTMINVLNKCGFRTKPTN